MNPLTQSKNKTILPVLITLTLACFAVSPQARATCQDACLTNNNTVQGDNALISLTTGTDNTAVGGAALLRNTTGNDNTATGFQALFSNRTGFNNTANGVSALFSNTTGSFNTANGVSALGSNGTGFNNTANGVSALASNGTGFDNTANGVSALASNRTGSFNTATGVTALASNRTGGNNTANGVNALFSNTTGHDNTADGLDALSFNSTGSNNIAVGSLAGQNLTTGNSNIDIGNAGVAAERKTTRIGTQGTQTKTFIAGIDGVAVTGTAVVVSSTGQLGVAPSSARFKDEIKPMDKASEAILALKPVSFRYKKELDPDGIQQFGLIAEQVEKVNPDLVVKGEDGKVMTVRYDAVNAMLLNEFLKEHKAFLEEQHKVQELEANAARQQKQMEALTAGLQKVSAQLDLNKPAARTVLNSQ